MDTSYRHTQYGNLNFTVLILVAVLITVVAVAIITEGRLTAAVIMIVVYLLGAAMFYNFTVEVDDDHLKCWFGIGLVRKSIPLSLVQSTETVVDPWYYVWGIKSIPGGWLYAIAPGPMVEIKLKDGKIFHIGSDQAEKLKEAIDAAIQASG
jgi:hypothetical protein